MKILIPELSGAKKHLPEPLLERVTETALLVFLALQPFIRHTAAIRSISFATAGLGWLLILFLYGKQAWRKNPLTVYLAIYATIAVISVFLGIEHRIGFKNLKANLIYQIGIFLVIINTVKTRPQINRIFYALVIGFSLLTFMGILESIPVGLKYYSYAYKHQHSRIIDGYSLLSTYYIPITMGLLLLEEKKSLKYLIGISLIAQLSVLYLYETRAALIAALAGMFLLLLAAEKYKWLLGSAIAITLTLGIMTAVNPVTMKNKLARYQSLLEAKAYLDSDHGLSGRVGLWNASIDMTKDRPWLGYGYGIKKFAIVATREENLNKWKDRFPLTYAEFKSPTPHNNPHNIFLAVLFETGIIGLIAFLALWGNLIGRLLSKWKQVQIDKYNLSLYGTVLGCIASFFLICLMNSLWYGITGKLIFVIIGIGALFLTDTGPLTAQPECPRS